jgi:hypothetical protein
MKIKFSFHHPYAYMGKDVNFSLELGVYHHITLLYRIRCKNSWEHLYGGRKIFPQSGKLIHTF